MSHFKGRDIVSIGHFTKDELAYLVAKAIALKKDHPGKLLSGKNMAYAFFEPSTRTRISFLAAASAQGMGRHGFGSAESTSMSKNESVHHTLRMLEGYRSHALVIRHSLDGAAQYAADKLAIPVINAGDGKHEHPTQTLLDLMAIQETQGRLDGLKIALVGDLKYGRTVHSLIRAMRKFDGNTFYLVNPSQLPFPEEYTHYADERGNHLKPDIVERVNLEEAIRRCDVIYMTRIQLERMEDEAEKKEALGKIQLRPEMFKGVKNEKLKVLHPLPIDAAHPEIDKTFDRLCPQFAYYFEQAANGLPMREILLAAVLGAIGEDFKGAGYQPPEFSVGNTLVPLETGKKAGETTGTLSEHVVRPVYNGTVIDHLPDHMAVKLYHALGFDDENRFSRGRTVIAQGLSSRRMGSKEILMVHDYVLNDSERNAIAMIAPGVTMNIVRNGHVTDKYKTQLPDKIEGMLECSNNRCISRDAKEDAPSIFYVVQKTPEAVLSCHYCDTLHGFKRGNLKTVMK